jgi:hypothetical protein
LVAEDSGLQRNATIAATFSGRRKALEQRRGKRAAKEFLLEILVVLCFMLAAAGFTNSVAPSDAVSGRRGFEAKAERLQPVIRLRIKQLEP